MTFVLDEAKQIAIDSNRKIAVKLVNNGDLLNRKQIFQFISGAVNFFSMRAK